MQAEEAPFFDGFSASLSLLYIKKGCIHTIALMPAMKRLLVCPCSADDFLNSQKDSQKKPKGVGVIPQRMVGRQRNKKLGGLRAFLEVLEEVTSS